MRRLIYDLKWAVIAAIMSVPGVASATSGITQAGQEFQQTAMSLKTYVKGGLAAIALICGAVGLVQALGKTNVEGEQASKSFIKWFVGAGFFAICWGLMDTLFPSN